MRNSFSPWIFWHRFLVSGMSDFSIMQQKKRLLKYLILKNLRQSGANIDINAFAFSSHAEIQNHFAFKFHITLANVECSLVHQVFFPKSSSGSIFRKKAS